MNRRSFLASILALGAAPAIVRAASLMKVVAPIPVEYEWVEEKIDLVNQSAVAIPKDPRIFTSEWGKWEGVRFYHGAQWSPAERAALAVQLALPFAPNKIPELGRGHTLFLHPSTLDDLKRSA